MVLIMKRFYTKQEAMEKLHATEKQIETYIRQGLLREFRDDQIIRFKAEEIHSIMSKDECQRQLPDGRWVRAMSEPYYKDSRPIYVKLWHCLGAIAMAIFADEEVYELWSGKIEQKWLVPVEPSAKERF